MGGSITIPFVETREVEMRYGSITALTGVNLQVARGETLALVGPSGSGKTTFLRILAGLLTPTSGEVLVGGQKVDAKGLRQIASMVFQRTVMFDTTVRRNVAFGLQVRGSPNIEVEEKVVEALKKVGLQGFERRKARKLSGGEQQRVSLARAVAVKPSLLLLDEPTANLDPANTSMIEKVISSLGEEGNTVVLATHRMDQAQRLADRVAIVNEGHFVQVGDARELFRKPSSFLASFGQLRNIFQGSATPSDEGLTVVSLQGGVQIEAASNRMGEVSVFVRPEDIIVSRTPITSSARNVLRGRIVRIEGRDGLIELGIDVGQVLVAVVTKRSFEDLSLNLGLDVFVAFKASSVEIV